MKKIFSIILSVIFAFTLMITLTLNVLRNNINSDTIMDTISNVNLYSYNELDIYLGNSNSGIAKTANIDKSINSVISDKDIDEELFKDIINDKEFSDFINKYSNDIKDYLTGKNDELNINKDEVNKIINSAIDKYERKTGDVINRDNLENEINDIIDNTTVVLDKIKDVKPLTTLIDIMLGDVLFYSFVILNFIIAIVILIINKNLFSLLKYLSVPSIVVGSLLLIIGLFLGIFDIIEISAIINRLSNNFKLVGIVTLVLGIIACVIGTLCNKEEKTKK